MKQNTLETTDIHHPISASLREELTTISEKCINCKLCQKECEFLRRYGKPKEIADSYDPSDKTHQGMPFECSLCQLCAAVCPVKINPATMFLEMRRESVRRGEGDYPEHAVILGYEKRGTSKRFSYYTLPEGCDTVFFPGCALSGTRPDKVSALYEHMQKTLPALGMVLDCCTKPSHDLGRDEHFQGMFQEMKKYLLDNGIRNVLVACPSCYQVFKEYGDELAVKTVYEVMVHTGLPDAGKTSGVVTIQDPCASRFEEPVHAAVRYLISAKGLTIEEMTHHGSKTLCCGEGGSVSFLAPELSRNWGILRKKEADGRRMITCCAGCANYLGSLTPTSHVLDLLFEPEATLTGDVAVLKSPFTYWNRLKLKRRLQKSSNGALTRERTFAADGEKKKGEMLKRVFILLLVIAAIAAIRFSGAAHYLEQDRLRLLIQGYGALAPLIYMLVYTIAPSLFLPGLPITIAGGILFGPFWGVVYTISSATLGACLAFLISRYVARDWVAKKLMSPRWKRLDHGVEKHGWKIVAFTRLIPLFPFNLLNYAFGLTRINFLSYAVTTLICMLPACIAFIVFSSSLLDLVKGRVSPAFLIGLGLVVLVSLIPLFYQRYKTKKGITDPL